MTIYVQKCMVQLYANYDNSCYCTV